jgi:hypothetical protein
MHGTKIEREIERLRSFAGRPVRIRLSDASEHVGTLESEHLSARAISVFLAHEGGEGATIYIEEIVMVCPIS